MIDLDALHALALRAHYGTSMSPNRRADGVVQEYQEHMQAVEEEFGKWRTDDNATALDADLDAYRDRYDILHNTYLHSHSNVVSAWIAGSSNFPVERMRKRSQWADNHCTRWLEFSKKRLDQLRRKYDPRRIACAPISSDDPEAIIKLQAKIEQAEWLQELMKTANKVVRKKEKNEVEQRVDLLSLGLTEVQVQELLVPDFRGKIGFAAYQLSNNNANIRRMKQRVEQLERAAQDTTTEIAFGDVRVVDNVEENRVQIFFPGKPAADILAKVKSNGFNWARTWSGQPWQRKRNAWALQIAKEIAEEAGSQLPYKYLFWLDADGIAHLVVSQGKRLMIACTQATTTRGDVSQAILADIADSWALCEECWKGVE